MRREDDHVDMLSPTCVPHRCTAQPARGKPCGTSSHKSQRPTILVVGRSLHKVPAFPGRTQLPVLTLKNGNVVIARLFTEKWATKMPEHEKAFTNDSYALGKRNTSTRVAEYAYYFRVASTFRLFLLKIYLVATLFSDFVFKVGNFIPVRIANNGNVVRATPNHHNTWNVAILWLNVPQGTHPPGYLWAATSKGTRSACSPAATCCGTTAPAAACGRPIQYERTGSPNINSMCCRLSYHHHALRAEIVMCAYLGGWFANQKKAEIKGAEILRKMFAICPGIPEIDKRKRPSRPIR